MEKTFNYFEEIENPMLRVWNRTVTFFNLHEDLGKDVANEYIAVLNTADKMQIGLMFALIKKVGREKAKELVLKDVTYEEDNDQQG